MNRSSPDRAEIRLSLAVFVALSFLTAGLFALTATSGTPPNNGAVIASSAAPEVRANAERPEPRVSTTIVISQVYGGGGNSGAPYTNDFIGLFNRGQTPVSLNGWSVQYASATGTGAWTATNLTNVTLQPGQYYLIQEAGGYGITPANTGCHWHHKHVCYRG